MACLVPALLTLIEAEKQVHHSSAAPGLVNSTSPALPDGGGEMYTLATRQLVTLLKAHPASFKAVTEHLDPARRAELEKALRDTVAMAAAAAAAGKGGGQTALGPLGPPRRGGGISLRSFGS